MNRYPTIPLPHTPHSKPWTKHKLRNHRKRRAVEHGSRRHSLTEDSAPSMARQRSNASQNSDSKTDLTHQSSTHSSLCNGRQDSCEHHGKEFQPYQADNENIWTDTETRSRSPSSTLELIDVGDYKPADYQENNNMKDIMPAIQQLAETETPAIEWDKAREMGTHSRGRGGTKREKRPFQFRGMGVDKYLTHTVRYKAASPEDCCQIVRKIQHLMLLEKKALNECI